MFCIIQTKLAYSEIKYKTVHLGRCKTSTWRMRYWLTHDNPLCRLSRMVNKAVSWQWPRLSARWTADHFLNHCFSCSRLASALIVSDDTLSTECVRAWQNTRINKLVHTYCTFQWHVVVVRWPFTACRCHRYLQTPLIQWRHFITSLSFTHFNRTEQQSAWHRRFLDLRWK